MQSVFVPQLFGGVYKGVPLKLIESLLLVTIVFALPARAYVDPGAGSMLYQVLLAAFIGVIFRFRRIAEFVRSKLDSKN